MGGAGSGEGVAGSTDCVARMGGAKSGILSAAPSPGVRFAPPGATGYEPPRMPARIKIPLAESPEHSYTAKIALKASFP
jgi:hypothetical protein